MICTDITQTYAVYSAHDLHVYNKRTATTAVVYRL